MVLRRRFLHRAVLFLLLAGISLGLCIPVQAASAGDFSDVSTSAWYYDDVNYVTSTGLFRGTTASTFDPAASMTRAMFITVLGRFAGVDPSAWTAGSSYHRFSDVSDSAYYAGYAIWAYELGIVNGMGSSDTFAPSGEITRAQVCAILNRYAKAMGLTLSQAGSSINFTDDGQISSWAREDVHAMAAAGVVNGTDSGAFQPSRAATRAEAAAMFRRFDVACGSNSSAPQVPPTAKPEATPESDFAPPTATPAPTEDTFPADDPVKLEGSVSLSAQTVRVGILVSTKSYDSCVPSVTLNNTNGTGFEYGVMDGRSFSSLGAVDDTYVTVTTDGSAFTVTDSAGNKAYTTGGNLAIHPTGGGKTVTCVNGEYRYYGDFELRQATYKSGYITVTNFVNVEDYVKGVLPYEFSNGWPAEVLKAAAVAVRSYVMSYDWSIYSSYGFDIIGNSSAQLYRGRGITYSESYYTPTDAAVDATSGQYLTYNGKICVTSYSSCDGGATRSAADVFGTSYPYLVGKTDPYEQAAIGDMNGSYSQMANNSHKVGMSAWGAYAMDKYYGKDYRTILGFYYTGTTLQYGA